LGLSSENEAIVVETHTFTNQPNETLIEDEVKPPQLQPPELKLYKVYKSGMMRLCSVLRKEPVVASITLSDGVLFDKLNVTMVLDYANDSTLDDQSKPTEEVFFNCFMYIDLYMGERFIMKTDSFKMNGYLDRHLETLFLGFIEEILRLWKYHEMYNWEVIGDKKWKYISRKWIDGELERFGNATRTKLSIAAGNLTMGDFLMALIPTVIICIFSIKLCQKCWESSRRRRGRGRPRERRRRVDDENSDDSDF
jgi:hypothetical protein